MKTKKNLTSREKIKKFCRVEKQPGAAGYVIVLGERSYRTDKRVNWMTEDDCAAALEALGGVPDGKNKVPGVAGKPCECGCGALAGPRARFRPGHDMKLKSALLKASGKGRTGKSKPPVVLPAHMTLKPSSVLSPEDAERAEKAFAAAMPVAAEKKVSVRRNT
jgi:hypothetical protein